MKELIFLTHFIPSQDRVLILPDNLEVTKSGLIIPKTAQEELPKRGTIVAVHKDTEDYPSMYAVGERVQYSKYSATDIELVVNGKKTIYHIMRETDVWGTFIKEEE